MSKTPKAKMMNILAEHHVPQPQWNPTTAWVPQEEEGMKEFEFTVSVTCETAEEAEQVMAERLSYDEDYGFEYQGLSWVANKD